MMHGQKDIKLELYLFASHCARSGIPDVYMFFYTYVIWCITIGGCNKCHCYGIV